MIKARINFEYGDLVDCVIIEGNSIEELKVKAKEELDKRSGYTDYWSEIL